MIVRIHSSGSSFKGTAAYLTHDPDKAKTDERVGWTHTMNLANDHIPSAVDEMVWVARHAELLKQEAGVRAGGREAENVVKHVSLNWAIDDEPSREHMISASEDFLRHMGWADHQTVIVAHEDKAYAHAHLMINAIHPETGLRLDDNFDHRRAQAWALEYEREQGNVRCENRLKDEAEREDAPTRPAWQAFQKSQKIFEENEKLFAVQEAKFEAELDNPEIRQKKEWEILKAIQKDERLAFFAEGKLAFSEMRLSVYGAVREEFRDQWADYYKLAKNGGDPDDLKEMKAALVLDQKTVLEERRDLACAELRESRNEIYKELLAGQREMRHGLHARQDLQLDSLDHMDLFKVGRRDVADDRAAKARETDRETLEQDEGRDWLAPFSDGITRGGAEPDGNLRSGSAIATGVASGLASGLFDLFAGFLDSGGPPPKRPPEVELPRPPAFDAAAEEARRRAASDLEIEEERRRSDRGQSIQ